MARRDYETLNLLRGMAALAVLIGHLDDYLPRVLVGTFAVDLFFVMSGFVIAHAYERRLSSGMSVMDFARVRAIRLYPLYLTGIILGLLAFGLAQQPVAHRTEFVGSAIPLSLAMLPAPQSEMLFPFNPVSWSLFFEVVVNALYVVTWRYWTTARLFMWMPIASAALFAASYTLGFDSGWGWSNALGGLARVMFSFPFGVLIYRLHRAKRRNGSTVPWLFPVLLGTACMAPAVYWREQVGIIFIAVPATVFAAVRAELPAMLHGLARFMGESSYAIYAVHLPVFWLIVTAFDPPQSWTVGAVMLSVIVLLSWLIHRYVDTPVRRMLSRPRHVTKPLVD